jgi:hypothetical protein
MIKSRELSGGGISAIYVEFIRMPEMKNPFGKPRHR